MILALGEGVQYAFYGYPLSTANFDMYFFKSCHTINMSAQRAQDSVNIGQVKAIEHAFLPGQGSLMLNV